MAELATPSLLVFLPHAGCVLNNGSVPQMNFIRFQLSTVPDSILRGQNVIERMKNANLRETDPIVAGKIPDVAENKRMALQSRLDPQLPRTMKQ